MERLEIPVLKALYKSFDLKKCRKRKSKIIFDWLKNVEIETGKMPKSKDRMYDVLNGADNILDFEHDFLNERITREWKSVFGENNLEREVDNIRAGFKPYKSRKLTEQDFA